MVTILFIIFSLNIIIVSQNRDHVLNIDKQKRPIYDEVLNGGSDLTNPMEAIKTVEVRANPFQNCYNETDHFFMSPIFLLIFLYSSRTSD